VTIRPLDALPPGARLGVSPLSWANDVLEDLGAEIPLETCLNDARDVGYQGVELGRKTPARCGDSRAVARVWDALVHHHDRRTDVDAVVEVDRVHVA
jgi:hypothetical protein